MDPLYLTHSVDGNNLLDELDLVSVRSSRRERPGSKRDRRRPFDEAFFAELHRISLVDHRDEVANALEKGEIGKDDTSNETEEAADPNIVWWDGDDDPANPLNWPAWSKWMNVGIVAMMTFIV